MKKFLAILLIAAMTMGLISFSQAEEITYQPGAYQAEVRGRNGMMTVETTFDEHSITDIKILSSVETEGIGNVAVDATVSYVLENQSLDMDTVTGATMTQNAVLNAVKNAVKQAGADPALLMVKASNDMPSNEKVELKADVVVVGAGLSGIAAAVAAAENGADVILLERCAYIGGNSRLSSGAFHLGATDLQASVGIEDTAESFIQDMIAYAEAQGGTRREETVAMVGNNGNDTLNWLMNDCGIDFSDKITAGMGDAVPRFTRATYGMASLFVRMQEAADKAGVKTMLETTATKINVDEDGRAIGVTAVGKNGQEYNIVAKNTILAAGGYRANEAATVEYTGYANLTYCGAPGAKGEMLADAISLGAATEYLDVPYLSPTYNRESLTAITSIMLSKGGILLNDEGVRFCNETKSYRDVALAILALGQKNNTVIEVLDGNLMELEPTFVEKYISLGIVTEYQTLADLCTGLGYDEAKLQASIDGYNAAVRGESEDEFGRVIFVNEFGKAPFYVMKVGPGGNISGGGLLTDNRCRVMKTDGSVFEGLYAVGETSGAGGIRAWGYAGGDALAFCAVSGKTAGEDAAANK